MVAGMRLESSLGEMPLKTRKYAKGGFLAVKGVANKEASGQIKGMGTFYSRQPIVSRHFDKACDDEFRGSSVVIIVVI